jgi:hypothetical protein
MIIDGKKCYFRSAARNLFRIDSIAAKHFVAAEGQAGDSLTRFLAKHIPQLISERQNVMALISSL